MELYSQYHRNKQKHQSHVMNNSPVAPTQIRNRSQDENEQKQSPVKVESLSKQDRMDLVSNKIPYIAPSQHAISNPYEMALKRRHGAKRALDKRQQKLQIMNSEAGIRDFYL
ncbi:hypothetical protein FGO68_gene3442 [Halteria grandinella]|uniref:Uncharacterized protein n=1 Tax=Halteria grandinella TaxID=5974 RepID=A0A8J8P337_HALGN|nr:hypothetical protein FGO68_gene3442 [Halteria grandinella]